MDNRYKFLSHFKLEDREKMLGERKMSLDDFERFVYLASYFGYREIERMLWDSFSHEFLDELGKHGEMQLEIEKREVWLKSFAQVNE